MSKLIHTILASDLKGHVNNQNQLKRSTEYPTIMVGRDDTTSWASYFYKNDEDVNHDMEILKSTLDLHN